MTGKSASELEREAEGARASIIQTAEALQHRMTPGRVMDDLGSYFKNSDGAMALDNLKHQVRDNPLPLALVGAGLAWLFMGGGPKSRDIAETAGSHSRHDGPSNGGLASDEVWQGAPGLSESELGSGLSSTGGSPSGGSGGAMKSASDTAGSVSGSAKAAGERVSSAASSAREGASRMGERAGDAANQATAQMRGAGSRAQRMFSDTLDQEPLILGALGLAVGAAIGAMLPRTRFEEENVAPYAEKARESLKETAQQGVEKTKHVASEAYRAGEKETERQMHAGSASSSSSSSSNSSSGTSGSAAKPAAAAGAREAEKKS